MPTIPKALEQNYRFLSLNYAYEGFHLPDKVNLFSDLSALTI